jgi:hypothetical protein
MGAQNKSRYIVGDTVNDALPERTQEKFPTAQNHRNVPCFENLHEAPQFYGFFVDFINHESSLYFTCLSSKSETKALIPNCLNNWTKEHCF